MADKAVKMDVLSVRVPAALKEQIEYLADQDRVTVDVAVASMLEEITEIERVRRMSPQQVKLEWKAIGGGSRSSRRPRSQRARKSAQRAARDAAAGREAEMAAWRATRKRP